MQPKIIIIGESIKSQEEKYQVFLLIPDVKLYNDIMIQNLVYM